MGQEERKNKAKLEKTQIQVATSNTDYETAIKALEETTGRWNRDWKAACDKFQDLEEERLDFTKSSLWSFANIASTVCVSDDASYEKMRVSLENCEVEKDIGTFIKEKATGQEIPDPPKYINFCRGDVNDTQSEDSDEDNYSVAQFQRTVNPSYRSSSPNPYKGNGQPNGISPEPELQLPDDQTTTAPTVVRKQVEQQPAEPQLTKLQHQRGFNPVPHNEFPLDGMTMYCRPGPPSELSSSASPMRSASRESASEYSNPTSISSVEPVDPQATIRKGQILDCDPEQGAQKKKTGFFQGHSPFRRKSNKDREKGREQMHHESSTPSSSARKPWNAAPVGQPMHENAYTQQQQQMSRQYNAASPEPTDDPRASYQLSVGNNVFEIANPDPRKSTRSNVSSLPGDAEDPIAAALAELRGATKQPVPRISADRYHGIATPAPGQSTRRGGTNAPLHDQTLAAAHRGTPPPSYATETVKRLDIPKPTFTSAEINRTQQRYSEQTQTMFGRPTSRQEAGGRGGGSVPDVHRRPDAQHARGVSHSGRSGAVSAEDQHAYRATSPRPPRSTSPMPMRAGGSQHAYQQQQQQQQQQQDPRLAAGYRSSSPNPYADRRQQSGPPSQHGSPVKYQQQQQQQQQRGGGYDYTSMQNSPNGSAAGRPPSSYSNPRHPQQQAPSMSRPHSRQPSAHDRSSSELALFQGNTSFEDLGSSIGGGGGGSAVSGSGSGAGSRGRMHGGGGGGGERPASYYGRPGSSQGAGAAGGAHMRSKSQAPAGSAAGGGGSRGQQQQEKPAMQYGRFNPVQSSSDHSSGGAHVLDVSANDGEISSTGNVPVPGGNRGGAEFRQGRHARGVPCAG